MANSTWLELTNRVLQRAGQNTIADASTFNTDASLSKVQIQAKYLSDEVNRDLGIQMPAQFLRRTGSISTSGSGVGGLPTLANNLTGWALSAPVDRIIDDTWFITTTNYGRKLYPLLWTDLLTVCPEGRTTQGTPQYFIVINQASAGADDKVMFDLPPDKIYAVRYEYYLDLPILAAATDVILWPKRLEPLVWKYAGEYLEILLGEGKAPSLGTFCEPMFEKVRALETGLTATPPHAELGFEIHTELGTRGRRTVWSPG